MRILVISNLYPPLHLGGYERRCAEVVAALRARGHVVRVLTSRFGLQPGCPRAAEDDDVQRALHVAYGPPYPPEGLSEMLSAAEADRRLTARVIADFRPNVIDVWGMDGISQCVVESLTANGAAVHLTIEDTWLCASWRHDSLATIGQAANELGAEMPAEVAALCGKRLRPPQIGEASVTFVSRALAERYLRSGFRAYSPTVRLAGLDLGGFSPAPRPVGPPFALLAVGQLTQSRGFEDVIRAAALAAERLGPSLPQPGPGLSLRIIGDGAAAYRARLTSIAAAATTAAFQVELAGALSSADVSAALASAHLFIHPSHLPEGLPRALVEALASGVPAIASDSGGQRDVLENGAWGALYPAGDVAALAARIVAAVRCWQCEPAAVLARAHAARDHVLHTFDFERYADGHLDDLRAAAASQPGRTEDAEHRMPAARPGSAFAIAEFVSRLARAASDAVAAAIADGESLFRLGVVLKRTAQLGAGARAFEALFARGDAAAMRRAAFHLGEIALSTSRYGDAEVWLRRCLAIAPDHRKADYDLTFAHARQLPPHLETLAAHAIRGRTTAAALT